MCFKDGKQGRGSCVLSSLLKQGDAIEIKEILPLLSPGFVCADTLNRRFFFRGRGVLLKLARCIQI